MKYKYYHNYKAEDILKYISVMSVTENNSRFLGRLLFAQMKAYEMLRRKRYDWYFLESVFENGVPQIEDPQEVLFVETVNTPFGSYRVFSSIFLTHKFELSQLLFLAQKLSVPREKLAVVYALLEISDTIASRRGYGRYVKGITNAEEFYRSNYREYTSWKECTSFSPKELGDILANNGLDINAIIPFLLNLKKTQLEREFAYQGHSDSFELHPLYKLKNGSCLVTLPTCLLRTAYLVCLNLLKNELGETALMNAIEDEMIQETGAILQDSLAHCINNTRYDGIPFLWFQFDKDKVANVAIVLADRKPNISNAICESERAINEQQGKATVFNLLVTQQMIEDGLGLMLNKPVTAFTLEHLKIVLSEDRMNLINLFYYDVDKSKHNFAFGCQEIDKFAYYYESGQTFYRDDEPSFMMVDIGYALDMRFKYLSKLDEHVVPYAPQSASVMVRHYADIPLQVPIYAPYMLVSGMFMLQLNKHELWVHVDEQVSNYVFCREVTIALFNWIYAAQYVKGIDPLVKNAHIEVFSVPDGEITWEKANDHTMVICLPDTLLNTDAETIESRIVSNFADALRECGFASKKLDQDLTDSMFAECGSRFMQIGKGNEMNIIDINDGVTSCHFVNKRCCDIILSEIADMLDLKGEERIYSFADSKSIMIKVSNYILDEVNKILSTIDTKRFLRSLLDLHHAMLYWSKLTQRRYESLSNAYAYVGATFDNQIEYVNDYSEMNTLTQGLIETIILNGIQNVDGEIGIEEIDRLFALMHFNVNMGTYMDQLGEKIPGSELVILANGRLAMPKNLIDKLNGYFYRLRKLAMEHPVLHEKLHAMMPSVGTGPDDSLFLDAFAAEYGISFKQYCSVINASMDYAQLQKSPIMIMGENDFFAIVAKDILITKEDITAFKDHFVLQESLPKDRLRYSDKWLQRFNRPVQITARPWILYEGQIYYSSKTVYESWMIKTERLNNGTITISTDQMQQLVASVNNVKGHAFTANVRKYYEGLAMPGLYINSEVEIMSGKPLDSSRTLGDIDVLLINKETKQIVCIEAKNYVESRTVYELIQQNRKIVDNVLSHVVDRDTWCKANIEKFKFYVPEIDDSYVVRTIFLTYHENAYNYFDHEDIGIIFISAMDIIENPLVVFA